MADRLALYDVTTDAWHRVAARRVIIAGFTGREQAAVQAHVDELRRLGMAVPESTPILMEFRGSLATTAATVTVSGAFTSGEVEPVVVVSGQHLLLTVGSDHTDRELERESIPLSKEACPKVIGQACVRVDAIADWDEIELRSWIDGQASPYQSGTVGELLPLETLLARMRDEDIRPRDGDVIFLGTIPVIGGRLRASGRFQGELRIPPPGHVLAVDYRIAAPTDGRTSEET